MDKALLLFKIGLFIMLSAAHALSPLGDGVVEQTLIAVLRIQAAAEASVSISPEDVPLADEAVIIYDESAPLSEGVFAQAVQILMMYELVNSEREKAGLNTLEVSGLLQTAAAARAAELEELYSHTRPDGREWATIRSDFNLPGRGVGENLNKNHADAEAAVKSWMNSEEHKHNTLYPEWNKMGAGVHVGGDGTMYWVILFTD